MLTHFQLKMFWFTLYTYCHWHALLSVCLLTVVFVLSCLCLVLCSDLCKEKHDVLLYIFFLSFNLICTFGPFGMFVLCIFLWQFSYCSAISYHMKASLLIYLI
uniref:Uncharacterized protein n=1 Tax=Cacopsylla melanoneura TaxID=428564 RepID=A0A8D8UNN1_9HEMI